MEEEEEKKPEYEILPDDYPKYDLSFKIIIIGNSGVGKSCLSVKATKNIFENNYLATVGFEFFNFNIKLEERVIRLQIWDTCGQEIYRSLITSFYHSSSLAILVYAINSLKSFQNLEMWLNEIKTKGNPDISIILIGNKCDLEKEREVTKEMVMEWCENNNIKYFLETSAKQGINIEQIFSEAARILLEQHQKHKYKIKNTESMKNILIDNESFDKNANKELMISDGDLSFDQKRKKKCCV